MPRLRVYPVAVLVVAALIGGASAPILAAGESGGEERTAPERGPDAPGVHSSPYADRDRNRIYDDMDADLRGRGDDERVTANVLFAHPVSDADIAELHRQHGGFTVNARWTVIDGFSAQLTKGQVQRLARRDDVVQIEKEREFRTALDTARKWYGVDKAVANFGVTGDRNGAAKSFTNTDVVACIIDTGIDASHVDFDQGQVIGWKDYVLGLSSPYDDNTHGTHVAGILAGQGDGNAAYRGVAPGTALVGVKVLTAAGVGLTSAVINGVNFCVVNKATFNIRILSMSLGSEGSSDGTDMVSLAVNSAFNAGILPAVAAGNEGPQSYTIGSPAAAAKALTVCSLADPGELGFFVSDFSSRGPTADVRTKPDLCAPGENITSALANSTNGYVAFSGTSMATPFASGVAALMLDANFALTAAQLKSKLVSTAQDWRSTAADVDTGSGRLQGYEAVKSAGGFSGTGPPVPSHYLSNAQSLGATGRQDHWQFSVTTTTYPVALTLIVPEANSGRDFDLYLERWNGSSWTRLAGSETTTRQETVAVSPTAAGTYRAVVSSFRGTGAYYLDFSHGGGSPTRTLNQ